MGHRLITRLSLLVLLLGLGGTEADAQAWSVTELEPVSRFETVDGFRLHYLDWGNESAPPLLLLHGNGPNAHFWDTFAPAMASFFRVIAWDAPHYGDSDAPENGVHDQARKVALLHSFADQLGLKRFILVGHSMGGQTGISYAALYPEDVERLVLVDIGPNREFDPSRQTPGAPFSLQVVRFDNNTPQVGASFRGGSWTQILWPGLPMTIYDTKEDAFEAYRESAMNGAGSRDFLGSMVGPERAAAEERFRQMYYHTLYRTADGRWTPRRVSGWRGRLEDPPGNLGRFFNSDEHWAHWRSIRCPILVIRGEHSQGFSTETAERMLRNNANARLVTIADSGHMLPLSHPAEFEAAIREWFGIQ